VGTEVGSKRTIDRRARQLNNELRAEAKKNTRIVQVGSHAFQTTVVAGGSYTTAATDTTFKNFVLMRKTAPYALVESAGQASTPYTAADVEAAVRQVSSCNAKFNAGVLAFVGSGLTSSNLANLSSKVRDFKGWRVDLEC
jgi:hypothetical protein